MKSLRRKRRSPLVMMAALFLASALLRVGTVSAEASDPSGAAPFEAENRAEPDIAALLQALDARATDLDRRDAQITDRMRALRIAEEEIAEKLEDLLAAEEALRQTMSLADAASQTDLSRLTSVYENMKPRDAADLFAAMAPDFAAGFIGMMAPEAAAAIMTNLPPDFAYSVSVMIAGRNATVPTQ